MKILDSTRVLVIMPAWNEAESVGNTVREVLSVGRPYDVVVVNDGSADATAAVAKDAGATVLTLPFNLGVGGAMRGQPALRQHHPPRRPGPPARRADGHRRERLGRVQGGEQVVQLAQAGHEGQPVARLATDGEALEVPRDVLAELAAPLSSPSHCAISPACRRMTSATSPRSGPTSSGSPAKARSSARNNQGRPRQPRPTTTPSQPVSRIIRSASAASHTSPLPRTGTDVTVSLSRATAAQSAWPE